MSLNKAENIIDFFQSCNVPQSTIDAMFGGMKELNGQTFVCSPFRFMETGTIEETPSFAINYEKSVYYDHSAYVSKFARGGHLNQLIVVLGGNTQSILQESGKEFEAYCGFLMQKLSSLQESAVTARKSAWYYDTIINNPAIGYDETKNALVLFTFVQAGRNQDALRFSLTKHAFLYPLSDSGHRSWINLVDPQQAHDSAHLSKVLFLSHSEMMLSDDASFTIPTASINKVVACEGEPDAISVSMFDEGALGISWKSYAIPEVGNHTPIHILSDYGAEAFAKQTAHRYLSTYDTVKFHDFAALASGTAYNAITPDDDFSATLDADADAPIPRHSFVKANFDITNLLERSEDPTGTLKVYLEESGETLRAVDTLFDAKSALLISIDDAAKRTRASLLETIRRHANTNRLVVNSEGNIQDSTKEDGSTYLMSRATSIMGYFAGYTQVHNFNHAEFPCEQMDEAKCEGCFVFRARTHAADKKSAISTVYLGELERVPVTLRMFPGSMTDSYGKTHSDSSRRSAMAAHGVTCGYSKPFDQVPILKFVVSLENAKQEYTDVECAPLDESVSHVLETRKSQQLFRFHGYYVEKTFMVAIAEPLSVSEVYATGNYRGRFASSSHSGVVSALNACEVESASPLQVLEAFRQVVALFEIALGSPGFLDRNFLGSIIVSLFSSSFVGKRDMSATEVMSEAGRKNLEREAFYCGNSLFVMGEVSSGKSETFLRLGGIFETVKTKVYSDIKATMFRPSSTAGEFGTTMKSFELQSANGGLMAFDGMQASSLQRNTMWSAKNIGVVTDEQSEEVTFNRAKCILHFEWIDTVLQRGTVAAQGVMATNAFGDNAMLTNAPLVFTGNLKTDVSAADTDALQCFYNFAFTVRGNVQALTKRLSPILARRGNTKATVREIPKREREDALFILRDLKLFQLQTLMIQGSGDDLFRTSQSAVSIDEHYMREAVARRAIAIANLFRCLRRSRKIHAEDVLLALNLIEDMTGEFFQYSDVRCHLTKGRSPVRAEGYVAPLQTPFSYDPTGTPFGNFLNGLNRDQAKSVTGNLFARIRRSGEIVWLVDLDELTEISDGTHPMNFFGLLEDKNVKICKPSSFDGTVRKVEIPTKMYESVMRLVDRLEEE